MHGYALLHRIRLSRPFFSAVGLVAQQWLFPDTCTLSDQLSLLLLLLLLVLQCCSISQPVTMESAKEAMNKVSEAAKQVSKAGQPASGWQLQ